MPGNLQTYRTKRHFRRTSEPRGKKRRRAGFSFVVQKHAARSLHYDFRLELDGVLLSWAVPKGPSLEPGVKRLAVQTEDHPLEYGKFEGVIPKGEYGAGKVELWDRGRWVPEGDPHDGYDRGRLTFALEGEKLKGGFHLVRTKGNGKARNWLLIKRNDREAPAREQTAEPRATRRSERGAGPDPSRLAGARTASMPAFVEPELATLMSAAPSGDEWLHELKLDGYRMQARCEGKRIQCFTRRGHDWSERVPSLVAAMQELGLPPALFDGELVVLKDGISNFQNLQNSLSAGRDGRCVFYVFDLLYFDGYDLRGVELRQRKALLGEVLAASGVRSGHGAIRLSEHVVGKGPEFFQRACELGAEGSVCKRADSRYVSGRGRSWLKVKCTQRQEFVIGGYSEPSGARGHFGALLLGVQAEHGLEYAGKVGTGFSERSLSELHAKLSRLERKTPAFASPPRGADARGVHWLRPELVAEIEFAERTADGLVRHATFRGLREDKPATAVHDERPAPASAARTRRARGTSKLPAPALPSVRLTHPDRVLYAKQGITKSDLALYYAQVAERMLPHVARRPLMIVRCPDGQGGECFHQKHPGRGLSRAVKRVPIAESKGVQPSMYVEDAEGLLQLVQIGALEIHAWGSRIADIEHPDQLTFDLDPDEGLAWSEVERAARELKVRLERLELTSFLKTTGGKGLHLVVPIEPRTGWEDAKAFCRDVAESMVRAEPNRYVTTISKQKRKGKLLLDYLRNGRGATAVCPYSTRAREDATVAQPIAWEELGPGLRPQALTVGSVPARIAATADPWTEFDAHRAALTPQRLRAAAG